jgi:hypothetical protein
MQAIEITTKVGCINRCYYCPQDKFWAAYKKVSDIFEMELKTFKTCLNKIPQHVHINFSGFCEPWLNPSCGKMVRYAYESKHPVSMFTTLIGVTLKDIESIKDIPFLSFTVHIPEIEITEEYIELMRRVKEVIPNTIFVSLNDNNRELLFGEFQYERWWIASRAGNNGKEKPKKLLGTISCNRNLRQNVLLPNGDVVLCCNDYGMKHVLGNLTQIDYESLFFGKEYNKVMAGLLDDSQDILCRYCDNFVVP